MHIHRSIQGHILNSLFVGFLMNTQEIINDLISKKANHAHFDDSLYEYYSIRTDNPIDLKLNELEYTTPATDAGPLSNEGENVQFRLGLTSTFKIGNILVNIAKLLNGTIQYTFIILKNASQFNWLEVLRLWQLEPLFSSS